MYPIKFQIIQSIFYVCVHVHNMHFGVFCHSTKIIKPYIRILDVDFYPMMRQPRL